MTKLYRNWLVWVATLLPLLALAAQGPSSRVMQNLTRFSAPDMLAGTPFAHWTVFKSDALDLPVLAFGTPVAGLRTPDDALQAVKAAARCAADFKLITELSAKNLRRFFFREMRAGLPVIDGRADLVFLPGGRLSRWSLRAHDRWRTVDGHYLDLSSAADALADTREPASWRPDVQASFKAWYPDCGRRFLRPVWWIRIQAERPDQRWEGVVDAVSGEVILDWPGIATDVISGVVSGLYWPMYLRDQPLLAAHPYETVRVNGTDITTDTSGHFAREAGTTADLRTWLRGPYVDVQNDAGPSGLLELTVQAPFSPLAWDWSQQDATAAELNLFHHTMFVHQWYKVLDPGFTALDYPVPAVANYGEAYDNAFWDGYGTYYGSGGQYSNFGMFSDVIYHEYTHGVTHGIYPPGTLPYINESGALNEAWSDYIACTINGDPYMAEYIGGNMFNTYFRNLQNNLVYPRDWYGEVHYDSRFVSAALWEIRAALGPAIADSLAHFSRYALAEDFITYLQAVLETDDDDGDISNGTPHDAVIYHAFGRHGIGPGDLPRFEIQNLICRADGSGGSVGNGDRFFEAGETIELRFDLANTAPLFPPPATNVQISILSADLSLTIDNGSQSVAQLPAGQSHSITPVLMHVSASAAGHWSVVQIDVMSNGGDAQLEQALEFTIGTPPVLIVEDDPVTDVERFIPTALRTRDRIYDRVALEEGQSLPAELLPSPGLVVWLSGNARGAIFTAQDRSTLQNYIASGNRVLLSGQNIADGLAGTAFARDVLQVEIDLDSLLSLTICATASPLVPDEWFVASGGEGAGNQSEETSFIPTGSSREIARYHRSGTGPVAAVECAGGNVLLFGFGIEAITSTSLGSTDLPTFFDRVYAWAGDVLESAPPPPAILPPSAWALGPAYPNPFNGTTMISYAIPIGHAGELVIYDLLGRAVESLPLTSHTGTVSWRPQSASGVYFALARWQGGQTQPVRLQLLK